MSITNNVTDTPPLPSREGTKGRVCGLGLLTLLTLVLVACGPDSKHIKLTGHLLNLNQGEFLVYSPDGAIDAVDTIYVEGGRFTFQPRCENHGSVIIVLPNKQEIPVFVSPGNSYSIEGDAYNIGELKVKGGKDNELMNDFRKNLAGMPANYIPAGEIQKFITQNPASPVGINLVRTYLLKGKQPDYRAADAAMAQMVKAMPDDAALKVMQTEIASLRNASAGAQLPSFSVPDINGNILSSASFMTGVVIFFAQASWDFESTSNMNRILATRRELGKNWKLVVVSFDASKHQCRNNIHLEPNDGYIVFDGNMAESPLARKLAIRQTGTAIVVKDGVIKERNKMGDQLLQELKKL